MTLVDNRVILALVLIALTVVMGTLVLLQPRLALHDESLTIIRTRIGELDVNHPPGHRASIWWQEPDRGINARWRSCRDCGGLRSRTEVGAQTREEPYRPMPNSPAFACAVGGMFSAVRPETSATLESEMRQVLEGILNEESQKWGAGVSGKH